MALGLRRKSERCSLCFAYFPEKDSENICARRRFDQVRIEGAEMTVQKFESVWDAIEDDPVKREIYKLRSELIHVIILHIKAGDLKQREVANLLGISQPRVSTLMKGDCESFRLDTLVGFAVKCGHTVSIDAA